MQIKIIHLAGCAAVCVAFCLATFAQSVETPAHATVEAPKQFIKARQQLFERVSKGDSPSFAVAVVKDGKIVWEEGIGWADKENGIPTDPNTIYALASISKSITAAAVDLLEARGKLRSGDPVSKYLGNDWVDDPMAEKVLISQILNHTSGIPHLHKYELAADPSSLFANEAEARRYAFIASVPGSRFLYTNLGYWYLARVVAKAGGAPFGDLVSRELLKPLGMDRTSIDTWAGDKGSARGYGRDGSPFDFKYRLAPDAGAGFLSTAHDLAEYSVFQLGDGQKSLSPASITAILGKSPDQDLFRYDRGWGIVKDGGRTFLISDGQMAGASTAIVLVPEDHVAVVVLSNRTGGPAVEAAGDILGAAVPGLGQRFKTAFGKAEAAVTRDLEMPTGKYAGYILGKNVKVPISIRFGEEKTVLTIRGKTIEMKNYGFDRGSLQLAALTGLRTDTKGDDEYKRLMFTVWIEDSKLKGFVLDELFNERPRYGYPYRVTLENSQK